VDGREWMRVNLYVAGAAFLGAGVEFTEALTIFLAVALTKGARTAWTGAVLAVLVLGALVAIIGYPLVHVVQLPVVQLVVGLIMLLFGMRWLRKAMLRASGYRALHNEEAAFAKELDRQRQSGRRGTGIDGFGAMTTFNGVFLEGLEAVFIVITVGLSAQALSSAVYGSVAALVVIVLLGVALRKPLKAVPENAMKYVVGVMLSSFGTFWAGEGLGVKWWDKDVSLLFVALFFLIVSLIATAVLKAGRGDVSKSVGVGH